MTEKIGLIAIFDTQQFNKGLNDYIKGVGEATGATEKAEKQGFSLTRALEVGVGVALEKVGEIAIATAGKLVDIGVESVSLASEFQTSMVSLQTAAADSDLSLDQLSELTLKVGADSNVLGASATGAADAMIELYRAGLKDNAVFGDMEGYLAGTAELGGVLKASFDLAAASELDVSQSAELGVVALSVFGSALETDAEKGQFAADALDNLVKTANASNASVPDLSEALKYAGVDANNFGMSIEDTNLALGLLSDAGIKGSMGGTTLSSVLRDLTKGTDDSTAALKEMGVAIYDTDTGATRPFIDIIGDMQIALEGKTDAEKDAYLQDIFTAQGMRGINVLLEEGVTGWNDMRDAIEVATGLQEQAAAQSQTYAGQMEALDGQIETLKIQFGTALLPALTSFLQAVMPIIEQAMPGLSEAFVTVGTYASQFATTFSAALNTVVAFIQTNMPAATEIFKNIWNEAVTFVGGVIEIFKGFIASIQPSIDFMLNYITTAWTALQVNATTLWTGIQNTINGALQVILGFIGAFISMVTGDTEGMATNLTAIFTGLWTTVQGIFTVALGTILTLIGSTFSEFQTTVSQAMTIIQITILSALVSISTYLKTTWDSWITNLSIAIVGMQTALSDGWESIKTTLTTAWENMKTYLSSIDLASIGSNIIQGLANGISSGASAITTALSNAVQGAIDAAKAKLGEHSPSKVFAEIGMNVQRGFAGGIDAGSVLPQQSMQNSIGGLMQSPVNNTTNNINNSRNVSLQINNTNTASNNTYFDVVAGLQAVGI